MKQSVHSRALPVLLFALLVYAGNAVAAERHYAPDRKVDMLHVIIDVTPDFSRSTVSGTTTLSFVPVAKPLVELRLDAVDLDVRSVTSGAVIDGYTATDEDITVTFDPPIPPGSETTVTVEYEAEPKRGLYFRTSVTGYPAEEAHLWTQGEAHEAPHWYPSYDYPNERSTTEVVCRVPKDMTVLSNGRLVSEEIDPATGLKAVRWHQDIPHVNYLVALVAGYFDKIESAYRDIPLAFYTTPSNIQYAQNSFKDTVDMMGFLERETGIPYPWNKYYQVAISEFHFGGMENTTLTILTNRTLFTEDFETVRSSQGLVVHELTHQWFGDYLTCKDWSHLWLNEGFATYYTHLYNGYKDGRDSMLYGLYRDTRRVLAERDTHKPIVYREYAQAMEQFDYRTYPKGSWVLHMLRTQLGEELFRECVKTYVERHALTSVVTEDFNAVIEELTGRSFDRFFDQWVYHARHPDITVDYKWSEKDKLAKVSVKQTHKTDDNVLLFHFTTKIRFYTGNGYIDREIFVDSAEHDFYFPLEEEPDVVRFDPEYGLLAVVTFDKPGKMLYAQLEIEDDVVGRLKAVETLSEKKDRKAVEALGKTLKGDGFYGVRVEAADALDSIHTKEAFEALTGSLEQGDARVRLAVIRALGGFYRQECIDLMKGVLKTEKNPDIIAAAVRSLGKYHDRDTAKIITRYLSADSFRNTLGEAAVEAIRSLDDPSFASSLRKALEKREREFTFRGFGQALDTLGYIERNEDDRSGVRTFLTGYVNHPNETIRISAVGALGTLGDPKATAVVESFSRDDSRDRMQRTAKEALRKLREQKDMVPEEVVSLRETVDELRKENEDLRKDVDDIKKRLDVKDGDDDNDHD